MSLCFPEMICSLICFLLEKLMEFLQNALKSILSGNTSFQRMHFLICSLREILAVLVLFTQFYVLIVL
jgi:hypothetical protein